MSTNYTSGTEGQLTGKDNRRTLSLSLAPSFATKTGGAEEETCMGYNSVNGAGDIVIS